MVETLLDILKFFWSSHRDLGCNRS